MGKSVYHNEMNGLGKSIIVNDFTDDYAAKYQEEILNYVTNDLKNKNCLENDMEIVFDNGFVKIKIQNKIHTLAEFKKSFPKFGRIKSNILKSSFFQEYKDFINEKQSKEYHKLKSVIFHSVKNTAGQFEKNVGKEKEVIFEHFTPQLKKINVANEEFFVWMSLSLKFENGIDFHFDIGTKDYEDSNIIGIFPKNSDVEKIETIFAKYDNSYIIEKRATNEEFIEKYNNIIDLIKNNLLYDLIKNNFECVKRASAWTTQKILLSEVKTRKSVEEMLKNFDEIKFYEFLKECSKNTDDIFHIENNGVDYFAVNNAGRRLKKYHTDGRGKVDVLLNISENKNLSEDDIYNYFRENWVEDCVILRQIEHEKFMSFMSSENKNGV